MTFDVEPRYHLCQGLANRGPGEILITKPGALGWLKQVNLAGLDLRAPYYLLHLKKKPLSEHARAFLENVVKGGAVDKYSSIFHNPRELMYLSAEHAEIKIVDLPNLQ